MFRRFKFLVGIMIFSAFIATLAQGQDPSTGSNPEGSGPPNLVMAKPSSDGVIGSILYYIRPITLVLLQFLNTALINLRGVQLPCTIYNIAKLDWTCTPVIVNVTKS